MRRNGMTRRQRSRFNKLAWAEQRALLELQWQQEREAREEERRAVPTPSTSPSPPPSPLPNARGHAGAGVTRAREGNPDDLVPVQTRSGKFMVRRADLPRVEESHCPTPDCQCSECRRYDEQDGHA